MVLTILFQKNYPVWIKLFIDFFLLALTCYLINSLIALPVFYFASVSHLVYAFILVFHYTFLMYITQCLDILIFKTSITLISGLLLSSLIFCIFILFMRNFYNKSIITFLYFNFFFISYRILIKVIFSKTNKTSKPINNIMIFSAGNSGIITKRAFYNSSEFKIFGFIDDDKFKIGKILDGVTVFKLGVS